MQEEPRIITVIRIFFGVLWTILQILVAVTKSIYFCIIPPEPKDVSEDIIVISGAGHGLGRAIALRFGRLGATVICVDINKAENEETARMINQEKGTAHNYECDISNRKAVFEVSQKIQRDVGDVTILVNNAGIMPCKPLMRHTEEEIRLLNELNINGVIWAIQAFLPSMLERDFGHIVTISSMGGLMGQSNIVPYCGSKFAVRGIMEALRVELHQDPRDTNGIKLSTICPSVVNSEMCQKPNVRYHKIINVLDTDAAADQIVDNIRREYLESTIPGFLFYINKIYRLVPFSATLIGNDFLGVDLDPCD
ncbi:epidermal retinol dehydrogenase 2-like [Aphomia sociella]